MVFSKVKEWQYLVIAKSLDILASKKDLETKYCYHI